LIRNEKKAKKRFLTSNVNNIKMIAKQRPRTAVQEEDMTKTEREKTKKKTKLFNANYKQQN